MTAFPADVEALSGLIGRRVSYQGRSLYVMEILAEQPAVVLGELAGESAIQADQFGEARRRVPRTWTIPVFSADRKTLHPVFEELELLP